MKIRKILSLLLTMALIITMVVPMTVSASFSDVALDHNYYDAIYNLSAEGILNGFEDGTFKPGEPVTRAQFTKIICYALSMGDITYSDEEKTIFTDVAPEHWAANNIVTGYKQGIINGMGDGTFAPESGVNYEQAVKMVVCALGHSTVKADRLGGYPNGYMAIANQEKILKGINDSKVGQVMNRGAVAQLIDNMLNSNRIVDGEEQESIRDEMGANNKVDGQVVAAYGIALHGGTNPCWKNQIELDLGGSPEQNLFDVSNINFDVDKFLGRSVTVYYEYEDGGTNRVVTSIILQPKKNEEITIDLASIVSYDSNSIEYYPNEGSYDTEEVAIGSCDIIFNGAYTTETSVKALLDRDSNYTKSGSITLVSADTDSTADVAFVKVYKTFIVEGKDTSNKKVYFKNAIDYSSDYSSGLKLDTESRNQNVTILKNGSKVNFASINVDNIISVAESEDKKTIEVLISHYSDVRGTITDIQNNNEFKLSTGDKIYKMMPNIYVPNGSISNVTAGKFVSISQDAFGIVAKVTFTSESSYSYGYLAALDNSDSDVINAMLYKVTASNKTFSTSTEKPLKFANRIKIDNHSYSVDKDASVILQKLKESAANANINVTINDVAPTNDDYSQPVRYTLNSAGEINAISTNNVTSGDNGLRLDKFVTSPIECTEDGSRFLNNGNEYRITSSTPIIYIPENRLDTYQGKTNSYFKAGTTEAPKKYYVQFANVSEASAVACVYLYGVSDGSVTAETITEETVPMIVVSSIGVAEENSTKKLQLKDVLTGTTVECYDNGVTGANTLNIGDVVRVALSEKYAESRNENCNFIDALEILAVATEAAAGTIGSGDWIKEQGSDKEFRSVIAKVNVKGSTGIKLVPGFDCTGSTYETYPTLSSSVTVYMVDTTAVTDTLKVQTVTSGEIIGHSTNNDLSSTVLVYMSEGNIKSVIIFK